MSPSLSDNAGSIRRACACAWISLLTSFSRREQQIHRATDNLRRLRHGARQDSNWGRARADIPFHWSASVPPAVCYVNYSAAIVYLKNSHIKPLFENTFTYLSFVLQNIINTLYILSHQMQTWFPNKQNIVIALMIKNIFSVTTHISDSHLLRLFFFFHQSGQDTLRQM